MYRVYVVSTFRCDLYEQEGRRMLPMYSARMEVWRKDRRVVRGELEMVIGELKTESGVETKR